MSQEHTHQNLLAAPGAGPAPTQLPADPAVALLAESGRERFMEIVAEHPSSSLCWALLAEGSLRIGALEGDVAAYAYARTGYHRGLDSLRRAGWKGAGPVPWEHVPNRGFLRALWALAQAAQRIGEKEEYERCSQFLRDSSETGFKELTQAKVQKPAAPTVAAAPVVAEPPAAEMADSASTDAASTAAESADAESAAAKPAAPKPTPAKPPVTKSAAAKPAAAKRTSVTRRAPGAKPSSVAKSVATAKQAATAEPASGVKP
jgi:hypothetical protein